MPTGYTAGVGDGKVTEFRDFAWDCARAFGALVMLRDAPRDEPIPAAFEPSPYHKEAEAKARAEYERLSKLTVEERAAECRREVATAIADRDRWDRERQHTVDRYREMLAKVDAWTPPSSDHDGLKRFMIEQLQESIKFDGPLDRQYLPKVFTDTEEWYVEKLAKTKKEIEYHVKEGQEERERTASRNRWIAQLRTSLDA